LFLLQLEFLTQECQKNSQIGKKFISARFPFTSEQCVLPHANPYIRYELPKHFRPLVIDLHHLPFSGDLDNEDYVYEAMPPQLRRVNQDEYAQCAEGHRLKESIENMTRFIRDRPNWFENTHVRRIITGNEHLPSADRSENDRLLANGFFRPIKDVSPKMPNGNQIDESSTPLLSRREPDVEVANSRQIGETEMENQRTRNHVDSVDSGVAVSSTKPNEQNDRYSKQNGLASGRENDLRQRLIS